LLDSGANDNDPIKEGVTFFTGGGSADYAEYLEKINHDETIKPGEIVGVFNGKVTKDTTNAQLIMAKSTGASVAGNWPGYDEVDNYSLIAFFGQITVPIIGPVEKGDYIIPSGRNDGTGIAIKEEDTHLATLTNILGRAWESSTEEDVKPILTAVGFNFSMPSLSTRIQQLETLEKDLSTLEESQKEMITKFDAKLNAQNDELEAILETIRSQEKLAQKRTYSN